MLDLPAESFIFCLQTKHQKELLQQFGANVLCMDSTHGTNQYDFKLITVMVTDQFGQGVSFTYYCYGEIITSVSFAERTVGWCICCEEEKQFVQHFLQAIKDVSPDVNIKTIMTDDGKNEYSVSVF